MSTYRTLLINAGLIYIAVVITAIIYCSITGGTS